MVNTANNIWRNHIVDGVSSSGAHQPDKADIRVWGTWVEAGLNAGILNGPWMASLSALNADLAHAANTVGFVYTTTNIGTYVKSGASGSGSWTKILDYVPGMQIAKATNNSSTANAWVMTTTPQASASDGVTLIQGFVPATNNSSTVTAAFDGGAVLSVKIMSNNNPPIGSLVAGMPFLALVTGSGTILRLLSDITSTAIQIAAEVAQIAAEVAQQAAELAASNAQTSAENSGAGYLLTFENETTGTPSAGAIRFNNANLSAATEAYVSVVNALGSGIADRMLELYNAVHSVKDSIIISRNESGTQASFVVDGAVSVGSPATHVTLTLSAHNGATSFTDADSVHLQRDRAGADGSATAYMQTLLDTTNADEAHVVLDSAARFSEHLGWKVTGLTADNKTDALATIMTLSADFIVLYNPSDDTTKRVFAPSPVNCSIATSGASGRDQVAAFVTGDDSIWFYFIWGLVPGLSAICSKKAPGAGGPTLPSTYTHFCPAFPTKVFTGITLQPALPKGGTTVLAVRGNRVFYKNTPYWDVLTTGGYNTPNNANFTAWVPSFATSFDIFVDLECKYSSVPGIGGAVLGNSDGNFMNVSLYAYTAQRWVNHNAALHGVVVPSRIFTATFLTSSGAIDAAFAYLGPIGYSF